MSLPIRPEDAAFEQQIAQAPSDFVTWVRYIEFVQSRDVDAVAFVMERACVQFPRSYKLWKAYLDFRQEHFGTFHLQKSRLEGTALEEFETIAKLYLQALLMLDKMPRLWLDYLSFLIDYTTDLSRIRTAFDLALQSLPFSQHRRLWVKYIQFASSMASPGISKQIWRRYCVFDPTKREDCVDRFIECGYYREAAELLVEILNEPSFVSSKGNTRQDLWNTLADLAISHEECGISVTMLETGARMAHLGHQGELWVKAAMYWIKRSNFEKARDIFEYALSRVISAKDFAVVFDNYVEVEEANLRQAMADEESTLSTDLLLKRFETLMDRRPFLINDVSLRSNPNNVEAWEARVELWKGANNMLQVTETFQEAIETVEAKTTVGCSRLWIAYAKFYEDHGDTVTADTILEKAATRVWFASIDELVAVWSQWVEFVLARRDIARAENMLNICLKGSPKSKVDFTDATIAPQKRIIKSIKLWSMYIDILESAADSDISKVRIAYERVIELKIATMLTFLNYALFLEQHDYYEDAFKVYERGCSTFSYPGVFELWKVYLEKALSRRLSVERMRDTFDQALRDCPSDLCSEFYKMYAQFEIERGSIGNALKIFARACEVVAPKDTLPMYRIYIERVAELSGLAATRPVYEEALTKLKPADAVSLGLEFADTEIQLGDIPRARGVLDYCSQFNDSRVWTKWDAFEVEYGSEVSYKDMLRAKRQVAEIPTNKDTIGFVKGGIVQ